MMFTIFTAWGYEVSALELSAVITSFTAVLLGARGVRMTWPWYLLSASLYALFFYQVDLIASALLQFVFIAAAIWGWLGWKKSGVLPRYMNNKERLIWLSALIASWLITAPALENIGAAATLPDSFLLISSTLAQAAMVLQRNETWIAWIVIDIFGTYHYANQGYWFTALLYGVFTVIAFFGLKRWKKLSSSANPI
ncbi:MAG: nicotinamide mononucleotide transporter [Actinobacteria bacterium BACL2 MAG-121220-bin52]|jgi:nicotinamide mononucleotide transporter|uniref:Nicotinamide mononucleotide transporter n=1 Tax=Actinobacteria bacterium BACL2 MAG-121220-bin52 TaxID=1655573 RepID=A0A0R2P5T1_9ACTN|nr:MAG: nicotinamide mononucleotide transporter [Actinobacteria bacterium BACL2 MAG-121220-bin52]